MLGTKGESPNNLYITYPPPSFPILNPCSPKQDGEILNTPISDCICFLNIYISDLTTVWENKNTEHLKVTFTANHARGGPLSPWHNSYL